MNPENSLSVIPEPYWFSYRPSNGYYDINTTITPYESTGWTKVIGKYGVRAPKVVDMTEGASICSKCNAKYAGYQVNCTVDIEWHMPKGAYYNQRGAGLYGEKVRLDKCGGDLIWEHKERFEEQKRFFSVLDKIANLPELDYDPMFEFEGRFAPGAAVILRERLLRSDISQIQGNLSSIGMALNTIAEKMNMAGGALRF